MPYKKYDKILVINSGSSSLKFTLFCMAGETILAKGLVERIGTDNANLVYQRAGEKKSEQGIAAENHGKALAMACKMLIMPGEGVLKSLHEVKAVGHRAVHGAEFFSEPVLVTEDVKTTIKKCSDLAPLHNPANLDGIVACETVFPHVPNVAVFDTAFHQTMPKHAYMYAIPQQFYDDYGIRKYGFHGTSHKFVMHAAAEYLGRPVEELKLITCHMGNGSSIAAIDGGKVLDTSMGLTPLPGMIMGTRCGDIDPAIIFYLARKGMSIDSLASMALIVATCATRSMQPRRASRRQPMRSRCLVIARRSISVATIRFWVALMRSSSPAVSAKTAIPRARRSSHVSPRSAASSMKKRILRFSAP
jgi:acetate kinase